MRKTLKAFVAEVYKPKSPDEQKFVDKHVVINHKDRNGNGDDVFSATNIKTVERKKTNKGYDVGDDEKVYEAADIDPGLEDELMSQRAGKSGNAWRAKKKLVGNQHKLDANGNGKIDAHDFKLLRKEEIEELDEISQKMVRAYRDKARDDKESAEDDREYYKAHDDNTDDEDKRIRKRTAGIKMAGKKIYGGAKVPMKNPHFGEEAEQIDEISKKLAIKTYAKRNADAFDRDDFKIGSGDREYDKRDRTGARIEKKFGKKTLHKAIGAAHKEIFGEEAEQIDENAKVVAHLQKRYGDNIRKSHVRSAANDFGVGYVALSHAVRKKLGVNRLEEDAELEEGMAMWKVDFPKQHVGKAVAAGSAHVKARSVAHAHKVMAKRLGVNHSLFKAKVTKSSILPEEVEDLEEVSTKTLTDYTSKAADARGHRKLSTSKLDKRYKGVALAHEKIRGRHAKVMASEEVEQIDELSKGKMLKYLAANKKDDAKAREKGDVDKMTKRMRGTDMAVRKYTAKPGSKYVRVPATEEVQIDEALDAGDRYNQHHAAIKELMKSIGEHIDGHKKDAQNYKDYRGKKGVNWGHVGDLASVHSQLAHVHDRLAQQGEYKKSLGESVEDFTDEDYQQIDELSRDTLRRYRMKAKRIGDNEKGDISYRSKGRDLAARKTHGGQWGIPKAKVMASEEVEQVEESWLPKSVHAELKRMPKDAVKRTHDTYMTTAKGFKRNGHHALAAQAHAAAAEIKQKYLDEEVEQIDELSKDTVRGYYNKAGEQGRKIMGRLAVGGGDWSEGGKDTKTLKKRAAGRKMALKRRSGEVKMSEEMDSDEISLAEVLALKAINSKNNGE